MLVLAGLVWIIRGTPGSSGSSGSGLATGAEVPSIAQPSTDGQTLSLQQLRGSKVVLYFYEGSG
ncbi:MAG TPA: hypothetical protein VEQ12_09190 [Candidatus Limnocylindria bacterium]|nr:hypothetical protein [Candidatus Limnocylindria bacterium]